MSDTVNVNRCSSCGQTHTNLIVLQSASVATFGTQTTDKCFICPNTYEKVFVFSGLIQLKENDSN